jgi:hypothetical protein
VILLGIVAYGVIGAVVLFCAHLLDCKLYGASCLDTADGSEVVAIVAFWPLAVFAFLVVVLGLVLVAVPYGVYCRLKWRNQYPEIPPWEHEMFRPGGSSDEIHLPDRGVTR